MVHLIPQVLAGTSPAEPLYPSEKAAHTGVSDVREVMPKCVVTVIFCLPK